MPRLPYTSRARRLLSPAILAVALIASMEPRRLLAAENPPARAANTRPPFAPSDTATTHAAFATVDVTPHPGDFRDVTKCVADCFETTLGYSTPAYVSLDVARSVTLLYRSGRAKPYGRVVLDASEPTAPAGSTFKLQLMGPSGAYVSFTNGTTSMFFARNPNGPTRIAAEFDASAIPTSAHQYTAYVYAIAPNGTEVGWTAAYVRIIIVNDQTSVYGAGVDIVGLQRLFTTQTGGVLVTDGSGSASFFSFNGCVPPATCNLTSPVGDFSVLSTANSTYRRTYPAGSVVNFNSAGEQVSVADRFGNTTQFVHTWNAFASKNVLTRITDPAGQNIDLNYRDNSNPANYSAGTLGSIQTPGGRISSLGVNPVRDLRHWVDVDPQQWTLATYDGQHRLTQVRAPNLGLWDYAYGSTSTPRYVDAPLVAIAGGTSVRPRSHLREPGDTLLRAAAAGLGQTAATALAVPTNLRGSVSDPRGNVTYFNLNRFGAPTKIFAPLMPADSSEYNAAGQLTRSLSPTGHDVRYTWIADRLTNVNDVTMGKSITTEYETSYSLPKRVYGSVTEQWFYYDWTKPGAPLQASRVGSSSAPATFYGSDQFGRITTITDPGSDVTINTYATSGFRNRTSVTAPNGQVTTYGVDVFGRTMSVQDPYGRADSVRFDALNRVSSQKTSPAFNDTTTFKYDSLNAPTVVTDAKGQVYTTQRNLLGWVTRQIDPASRVDSMAYDTAGNVVYARTRANRVLTFAYDSLNRLRMKTGAGGADSIVYTYDVVNRGVRAKTWHGAALVSTDWIFSDSAGRTIAEQTERAGANSAWYVLNAYNTLQVGRTFVGVYRLNTSINLSSVWFVEDALKRLSAVQLPSGQTTLTYNAEQQRDTIKFPSTLRETWEYTPSHVLARRSYNVSLVQGTLGRAYRTDSLARLVERADTVGKFQTFDYDIRGRLNLWKKQSQTGTPVCVNSPSGYGYDCSGTAVTTQQVISATYDNVENPIDLGTTADPGNQLRTFNGVSIWYDLDGNMVKRSGSATDSLVWDDFGQLKTVIRAGVVRASFDYDGFGRRIRKTSAAGTVQYVWDGDQIILEADASGNTTQSYTYYPGVDRLHSVTAGGVTYYASIEPASGDINGLIKGTNDSIAARYAYTPWGELDIPNQDQIAGQRVNSLRWKGLPYDDETGLYYMRARYYDPKIRRFISEDPIGLEGGINEYVFAGGDPVNGSDPSGLDGNGGCWALDYTVQYGSSEPFRHYVQVACPSGQALSEYQGSYWGPRSPSGLSRQSTFTNSGTASSSPSRASVAARKILACSDEAVGFGLSFMGSKGFYEGAKLTSGLAKSAIRAIRSNAGAGGSLKNAARNAADIVLYSGASVRAGAGTLGALGGAGAVAFHDTYFTPATARNALELAVGFVPVIGTVYAGGKLVSCLFQN